MGSGASLAVLGASAIGLMAFMAGNRDKPVDLVFDPSLPAPVIDDRGITSSGYTVRYTLDGSLPTAASPMLHDTSTSFQRSLHAQRILSIPTSIQWRHPVGSFPEAVVVRACACDGGRCGPVTTRTLVNDLPTGGLPMLSIALPEGALFDPDTGILVVGHAIFRDEEIAVQRYPRDPRWWKYPGNFHFRGSEWERRANVEFLSPDGGLLWACG
jgi:chitobiase/beta-hexosaminidase-like protein